MNQEDFISRIRVEIVDQNLEIYRDIFANKDEASAADPYWSRALSFYALLNDEQRSALLQIIRQVMVDAVSNLLGIIDGVSWLEGQHENFKLTTESGTEKLNDGLQDLFLGMEEEVCQ